MKNFRKKLSLILCLSLVMNFALPSIATNKNDDTVGADTIHLSDNADTATDTDTVGADTDTDTVGADIIRPTDSVDAENDKFENDETIETTETTETTITIDETTKTTSETTETLSKIDNTTISTTETETKMTDVNIIDEENNVSTPSDINLFGEETEEIATKSTVDEDKDYTKLNTIDQFNYQVSDSAKLVDDTIVLMKDVTLFDIVKFTDNINLDLNGYNIIGPDDNYTLYIENNFTLLDSSITLKKDEVETNIDDQATKLANDEISKSSIKSTNPLFPVIYAKNAVLNLNAGSIIATDGKNGGDALHLYYSDINVDGAIIKAGNGFDNETETGGDGGNAIVVYKSTNQNIINVNSGFVYGGNGGKGIGDETPDTGAAISFNGIYQGGTKVGKGLKGKKGGGNGGIAIKILSKDFKLDKLTFEFMTLYEGSAGRSIVKTNNETKNKNEELFGTIDEEVSKHYYSLYDLDGKNYLTSLKNQADFGLCAVYAICAQAETYMMMEFPEFVKKVCNKVTDTVAKTFPSRNEEINLSEVYFGLAINKTPTDAFGNAGHSDAGNTDGWTWGTSTQTQLALASTWRGFVWEDETISDKVYPRPQNVVNLANSSVSQSYVDSYANKTVVHAKNMRIYDGLDYVNDENQVEEDRLINDLKRAIVKNHGVYFGIYLGDYYNKNYVSSTGVNYGNVTIFTNYKGMSGNSGHGMFIIGWDDDYEFKINSRAKTDGSNDKGVFILKNSWDEFALIPKTRIMNWASYRTYSDRYDPTLVLASDFVAAEYMPAFSEYENNYFYDTGVSGVSMNSKISITDKSLSSNIKTDIDVKYKKVLNVFKIRNDKEKAVAVSFYGNQNDREYEVALYRVPNDTNESQIFAAINNENNKLTSKTFNTFHGVNVIDFDTPVDLLKGQYVAVVITADEPNIGRIWVDGEGKEEVDFSCTFNHTTTVKQKSFLTGPTIDFKNIYKNDVLVEGAEFNEIKNNYENDLTNSMSCYKITNANVRIKLLTNNYVTIDTGTDGNIGGNTTVYYYPHLKATMSDIPEPTVTNADKRFIGYNTKADGTGKNYDKNSIYSLNIAEYLKLYAQYENIETPTESTSASTDESTSATTDESTSGSIAPTESTKTPTKAREATRPYSGGGGPGGGGGGGGGAGLPANIAPPEIQGTNVVSKVSFKSNDIKINIIHSDATNWAKDTLTNKWKLNVKDINNNDVKATVGFYIIDRVVSNTLTVSDTYYIDNDGNMLTGWLNTADDKWYFFDDNKNSNEGKMSIGWKKIQNDWYYFASNGIMLTNGITPDGYKVGADGKYQQ